MTSQTSPDDAIRTFVSLQRRLLDLELGSELEAEENGAIAPSAASSASASASALALGAAGVSSGSSLAGLRIDQVSAGLYGRTVVTLVPVVGSSPPHQTNEPSDSARDGDDGDDGDNGVGGSGGGGSEGGVSIRSKKRCTADAPVLLPAHKLTVGDEVEISSKGGGRGGGKGGGGRRPAGVVCAATDTSISVALFDTNRRRSANGRGEGGETKKGKGGGGSGGGSSGNKKKQSKKVEDKNEDENDDDDDLLGLSPPLALMPRSSAEVHRKMKAALDELAREGIGHPVAGKVIRAAFGDPLPTTRTKDGGKDGEKQEEEEPFDPNLDRTQIEAVSFALSSSSFKCDDRPISLIHGPPGTGKTTTLVELVRRAVHRKGWRVLVCAPSNVAVDNVLEKLVEAEERGMNDARQTAAAGSSGNSNTNNGRARRKKMRLVRLGHPARLRPTILPYSLEHLVKNADGTEIVRDVRTELESYIKVLSDPKSNYGQRRIARREVKALRAEVRRREEAVVREVLGGGKAMVVLATNIGAASSVLDRASSDVNAAARGERKSDFDLVVIDEAAQALEASCWIPILRGRRLVLAGDHRQLPPTVQCRSGEVRRGLGRTLFERIMRSYGDDDVDVGGGRVSRMLRVQYRMHADIADWSSEAMYGGKVVSHESVRSRRLADLPHFRNGKDEQGDGGKNDDMAPSIIVDSGKNDTGDGDDDDDDGGAPPLLLIDTAGCDHHETLAPSGSRFNRGEATLVARHVRSLLRSGLRPADIAVISPYNGQVELLRSILLPTEPALEIRSVDGFQGGEREAVVMSLVRSSDPSEHRARASGGPGKNGPESMIGFLSDDRRLNVAITRAKRHCCVICDSETVSRSDFLKGMVRWFEEKGEVRSAAEFDAAVATVAVAESVDGGGIRTEKETEIRASGKDRILSVVDGTGREEGGSALRGEKSIAGTNRRVDQPETVKAGMEAPSAAGISTGPTDVRAEADGAASAASYSREEDRRKSLLDRVASFAERGGRKGLELTVGTNLPKYDRLVVQQLAEQLGLGCRTEGAEGIDQRVLVSFLRDSGLRPIPDSNGANEEATPSGFAALGLEDGSSSDSDDDVIDVVGNQTTSTAKPSTQAGNSILADLARERMERQRKQQQQQQEQKQEDINPSQGCEGTKQKGKKKKKKGSAPQRLGGTKPNPFANTPASDEDRLDDMAFLDAQIEKVQTSHGRKVEGSGKAYKSIINGMLIAKPPPREEKKDEKAGAALRAKLKKAEEDRKAKVGKKKKK